MGWNSWDCYGPSVTEEDVRRNAEWMARNLKVYGWQYIVVDIQWYEPAADGKGFGPLADFVHGLGLKFGIHIMRGIPRQAVHQNSPILGSSDTARQIAHPNSICPWNTDMYGVNPEFPGARAYYRSLFDLYASWGVDFVKADDIAASRLYGAHLEEIRLIRDAVDWCGRDIVLSLSPGPAPLEHAGDFAILANMWRITDDFWDRWELLLDMFFRCGMWHRYAGPGHWPDCDILPLGHIGIRSVDGDRWTRFTKDEQLAMMTLWTIFRSPLMFGGELADNDPWTTGLLTNAEVLEMHRQGLDARPVRREGPVIVWTSGTAAGERFVACFNTGETATRAEISLSELGLPSPQFARDLWEREELAFSVTAG